MRIDPLDICSDLSARAAAAKATRDEVFLNRQAAEAMAAFKHLHETGAHQSGGACFYHIQPVEPDAAGHDLSTLGRKQIGQRLQHRRFARTIGAKQRQDFTARQIEADIIDRGDGVIVRRLEIIDGKQRIFQSHDPVPVALKDGVAKRRGAG